MTTDNLQNRLIQTSQTGGQRYSDTSTFSIPCLDLWMVRYVLSHYATAGLGLPNWPYMNMYTLVNLLDTGHGILKGEVSLYH
jgi:hypothetical protein